MPCRTWNRGSDSPSPTGRGTPRSGRVRARMTKRFGSLPSPGVVSGFALAGSRCARRPSPTGRGPLPEEFGQKNNKQHPWNTRETVVLILAFLPLLCSCTQQMADQPRYDPLQSSSFFSNGSSARPLPDGVIPHDYAVSDSKPANGFPFPLDKDFILRGRQRYDIYCSPCHDYLGTGNGMAARRGFQRK